MGSVTQLKRTIEAEYKRTRVRLVPFATGNERRLTPLPILEIDQKLNFFMAHIDGPEELASRASIVCVDHWKLDSPLCAMRHARRSGAIKKYMVERLDSFGRWVEQWTWAAEVIDVRRGDKKIRIELKTWGRELGTKFKLGKQRGKRWNDRRRKER